MSKKKMKKMNIILMKMKIISKILIKRKTKKIIK